MFPFDNEDEDEEVNVNPQNEDQQEEQEEQEESQTPVAPSQPAYNPADIAAIVASTMQSMRAPEPQRQMTAEEAATHFQVWNPEPGFVNDLNKLTDANVPLAERQALLNQMRDGMVNQSFRAAELLLEQKMQELDARYAPVLVASQQAEAKQLQKDFERKYPQLKGQEQLVNSITAGLTQQGFKPKSKDEAFESVARLAEGILQKVNPEFKLSAAKTGGNGRMPTMAGTGLNGHSGGFQTQPSAKASGKRGGLAPFFLTKK